MSFIDKLIKKKKRSLFVLAPMADVTDIAFRTVVSDAASPDIYWTEFVSADGLILATDEGKYKLKKGLLFDNKKQRPIIAQLFSSKAEYMYQAVKLCIELGFDGVDINMGCPDRSIEKQKCGAAMIKYPELAKGVIEAAKKARIDFSKNKDFAVTVKTRVGYNKVEIDTWIPFLLNQEVDLITIHARTRKEMSKVPANWDYIKQVVDMRNDWQKQNPDKKAPYIFGNGDVMSVEDGYEKCKNSGAHGAMIGRAMFGNPWFFKDIKKKFIPKRKDKIKFLIKQIQVFDKKLSDVKSFALMKKFFKTYMSGFDDAKDIRTVIMDMNDSKEVIKFLKSRL